MVKQWLRYAVQDLRLAQKILLLGSEYKYHAGFHAQQAVEKSVKAILVQNGVRPPHTHSLEMLAKLVSEFDGRIAKMVKGASHQLTDYAVAFRYPDAEIEPATFQQVKRAVSKAKAIFDAVIEVIG